MHLPTTTAAAAVDPAAAIAAAPSVLAAVHAAAAHVAAAHVAAAHVAAAAAAAAVAGSLVSFLHLLRRFPFQDSAQRRHEQRVQRLTVAAVHWHALGPFAVPSLTSGSPWRLRLCVAQHQHAANPTEEEGSAQSQPQHPGEITQSGVYARHSVAQCAAPYLSCQSISTSRPCQCIAQLPGCREDMSHGTEPGKATPNVDLAGGALTSTRTIQQATHLTRASHAQNASTASQSEYNEHPDLTAAQHPADPVTASGQMSGTNSDGSAGTAGSVGSSTAAYRAHVCTGARMRAGQQGIPMATIPVGVRKARHGRKRTPLAMLADTPTHSQGGVYSLHITASCPGQRQWPQRNGHANACTACGNHAAVVSLPLLSKKHPASQQWCQICTRSAACDTGHRTPVVPVRIQSSTPLSLHAKLPAIHAHAGSKDRQRQEHALYRTVAMSSGGWPTSSLFLLYIVCHFQLVTFN